MIIQNTDDFNTTEMISNYDWKLVNITEVLSKNNGIKIGPFGSQLKRELLTTTGYKVYGQENVYENDFEIGTRYISKEHFQKLNSCELNDGDFVISMMGTIGKCSIIPKNFEPGIMDSHLIRLRLDSNKIDSNLLLHFFSSNHLNKQIKRLSVGGIMEGLSSKIIKQLMIPLPPTKAEQTAIATALSDVDALINSLEKLINKKKAIKQGAMQELLKPKEGWKITTLESEIDLLTGYPFQSNQYVNNGIRLLRCSNIKRNYIDWNEDITKSWSKVTRELEKYLLNESDIVIAMDGSLVGKSFGQITKKDLPSLLLQRVARIRSKTIDMKYLKEYICSDFFTKYCDSIKTASAIPHISPKDINNFTISFPLELSEQKKIANTLNDMNEEIIFLEKKIEKQKMIKQGMMQNLLTGRIRIIQETPVINNVISIEEGKNNNHNWQYNEAVVIAVLAKKFGTYKFPLTRFRYTKFSYLLHRYMDESIDSYMKKAAGPYNPKTRYKGPEKIAIQKKYIKIHKTDKSTGFLCSENIPEAESYFEKWYGIKILDWLEQFHYETNDSLELLTTVDKAILEIKENQDNMSVSSVKSIIKNSEEWKPKLERTIFSDFNIEQAIHKIDQLFSIN